MRSRIRNCLLVSVAGGLLSTSAHAVYKLPAPGALPADTVPLYITGAQGLDTGFIPSVCLINPNLALISYENSGQNFWAVYCDIDRTKVTGLPPGKRKLLLTKRRTDGSVIGVIPLLYNIPVQQLEVNTTNCTPGSTAAPLKLSATQSIAYTHNCASKVSLTEKLQHLGISDAEPELFIGDNVPTTWTVSGETVPVPTAFKPANAALVARTLTVRSVLAKMQGIPVTLNLRNALQSVSFPLSSPCNPSNAGYARRAETLACMPSLSASQIASLFTGSVEGWDTFKVKGVDLTHAPGVVPPANAKVLVCRRDTGIGTEVVFAAQFLNNPCNGKASLPIAVPDATYAEVVKNNSFDDMDNCLHNANAANRWAIGMNSMDKNLPNATTGLMKFNYRYIRINGVEPTLPRVHDGSYPWWEELTAAWKKTLSGPTLLVVQQLIRDAARAETIRPRNGNYTFGPSGYLALTQTNNTLGTDNHVDAVFRETNPVTAYTHAFGAQTVSQCRIPTIDQTLFPQVLPLK